jgi:hypothetical protein
MTPKLNRRRALFVYGSNCASERSVRPRDTLSHKRYCRTVALVHCNYLLPLRLMKTWYGPQFDVDAVGTIITDRPPRSRVLYATGGIEIRIIQFTGFDMGLR